jgi:hypothetical protein
MITNPKKCLFAVKNLYIFWGVFLYPQVVLG